MVKYGLGFYTRKNEIRRRGRKFTLGACVQICILEAPFTIFAAGVRMRWENIPSRLWRRGMRAIPHRRRGGWATFAS